MNTGKGTVKTFRTHDTKRWEALGERLGLSFSDLVRLSLERLDEDTQSKAAA